MSEILLPESSNEDQDDPKKLKFKANDDDEERFFLMYHMNFQPSEAEALSDDYRKWLIARFMVQKKAEQAAYEQAQIRQALGPNLGIKT